ncbi:MAG: hypothetical protein GY749_08040 [Desulfobacteraceae bacterium]|nr:hypothetical protein [Desulfobacteraceae bacterium]
MIKVRKAKKGKISMAEKFIETRKFSPKKSITAYEIAQIMAITGDSENSEEAWKRIGGDPDLSKHFNITRTLKE